MKHDSMIAAQIKEYEVIIGNIQLTIENPATNHRRQRMAVWHLTHCHEMIKWLKESQRVQDAQSQ